eukprot:gnl/MRDRNA2_/MRDRNA2_29958_c0_seq1.p1 gnl/MRDRNA2_/MRDRNA2_29958_c0~~gnl/MRDRNA2_/MRDRNA2_29958_c0_seq1.p1  ORF type:complete len:1710 (+),score=336.57 gnl/MRDRNA2_/MRDRNA2_29958_c0_seq1:304-5130(+)
MPTGFKYKVWLLASNPMEWTSILPGKSRHCIEFDFEYVIKYEEKLTPFEVGPSAWLCEYSRLPTKIMQVKDMRENSKWKDESQTVYGRTIWVRDRFGFPPDEISDMEHTIEVTVTEASIFRATTHHSDSVDVHVALTATNDVTQRLCKTLKHPGPVPRQTIFCRLDAGTYHLKFFADYPLGGLHPCSDFFAQISLKPTALIGSNIKCLKSASDLSAMKLERGSEFTSVPRWRNIKVPIKFADHATTMKIWSEQVEVTEEMAKQHVYLRLTVQSDYLSSDLRFQVKTEGKYIADPKVTSHGYADMIGPLDEGFYIAEMYYVAGQNWDGNNLCSKSTVDLRLISKQKFHRDSEQWICAQSRVPLPDFFNPQEEEHVLLDSEYSIPESGQHRIKFSLQEDFFVKVRATSADADFRLELKPKYGGNTIATGEGDLYAMVDRGNYQLSMTANVRGAGQSSSCLTMHLNLLLQPKHMLPPCPWAPAELYKPSAWQVAQAQIHADDHIGNVLVDLVPKHLSKDLYVPAPVTLWMNQDMEKTWDLVVDQTAALRLDVVMSPPWLPLTLSLRRKKGGKKGSPLGSAIGTATWIESRLLLLMPDLPKGSYVIELKQTAKYTPKEQVSMMCSHVTIHSEIGIASKEVMNSMRSEMLQLADLLAVQPFPQNFNAVGWLATSQAPVLTTQIYSFPSGFGAGNLKLDEKGIMRIVCEPADLSNAEAQVQVSKGGSVVAVSDKVGHLVAELEQGTYEIRMRAKVAFLVTIGLATYSRLKEDVMLLDSGSPCVDKFPELNPPKAAKEWTVGPKIVRLSPGFVNRQGELTKIPIVVAIPSILYIEAGSAFPLDAVRIGLQVPEGLWVGEQRGMRNALQIELPPGKYSVQLSQPIPVGTSIERCLDFSVFMATTPLNPDAEVPEDLKETTSDEETAGEASACFSMGAVPLPLDLSTDEGGSAILGGPIGSDGRLLIRQRVLITDMHDGRKKIYLGTGSRKLTLKVGTVLAGYTRFGLASQLTFIVQVPATRQTLEPAAFWAHSEGWERVYQIEESVSGLWLIFRHDHRERSESACIHFALEVEVHPANDLQRMIECQGRVKSPEAMFPDPIRNSAIGKEYHYAQPLAMVREPQGGMLRTLSFSLSTNSWIQAEVGHNFFLSHVEMDLVSEHDTANVITTSEQEFINKAEHPVNSRQWMGRVLPAGSYLLRIADDHYKGQFGASSACFPFTFHFRVVPHNSAPSVVSLHPHPSMPIPRGVDIILTIRFSESPSGAQEDVVRSIFFGDMQAVTGGSLSVVEGLYSPKKSAVRYTTQEGNLVWIVGWNSRVLGNVKKAKLTIGVLKSNSTGQPFRYPQMTYTVVDVPEGKPWRGSRIEKYAKETEEHWVVTSEAEVQKQKDAAPANDEYPEDRGKSEDIGGIKSEGDVQVPEPVVITEAPATEAPSPPPEEKTSEDVGKVKSEGSDEPQVDKWDSPSASDSEMPKVEDKIESKPVEEGAVSKDEGISVAAESADDLSETQCPEGSVLNAVTKVCESIPSVGGPPGQSAYLVVLAVCGLAILGLLFRFNYPKFSLFKPTETSFGGGAAAVRRSPQRGGESRQRNAGWSKYRDDESSSLTQQGNDSDDEYL